MKWQLDPEEQRRLAEERRLRADDEDEDEDEDEEEDGEGRGEDDEKLQEKLLKTRTILISEPVSDELARKVYQQLLILEADSKEKPITVIINSPGGEADSGFGIYDMLRFIETPIRTLVAGLCASAAVIIFLGGDDGQRFTLPNARFLLHQPSSQSMGQASDLQIASDEIVRLRKRYNSIVAEVTGRSIERIDQDADRDFWMTAAEALEYKLVSRVVTKRSEMGSE
jgi:ATP-dependent Clp protease, protease subunit